MLDQVDVLLEGITGYQGDLTVEIRTLDGNGLPDALVGSAGTIDIPDNTIVQPVPVWISTSLSANVTQGTDYAITVGRPGSENESVGCWNWRSDGGLTYPGTYADGTTLIYRVATGWALSAGSPDSGFKTYVTASTAYTVSPFSQPVDNQPTDNLAQAGKVIPFRFSVTDQDDAPVTNLTASDVSVTLDLESCSGGTIDPLEGYAVGTGLVNLGGGNYVLNYKTNKGWAGGCGTLTVETPFDGSRSATFKFK